MTTQAMIFLGLGIAATILCLLVLFGYLPHLRIVPDNTKFNFVRFRRISFPISAVLSILAITLYFTHGLNFGIDFKGGTLLEVQSKSGPIDIGAMRTAGQQVFHETGRHGFADEPHGLGDDVPYLAAGIERVIGILENILKIAPLACVALAGLRLKCFPVKTYGSLIGS